MNITLQINRSEKNKMRKNIEDVVTLTGTLKTETSLVDPKIIIEGDLSEYVNVNYLTISEFGRSYFINDIRSVREGLFEVTAHVDVLSTYADQIASCKGIVHRQENAWNLYLNDGSLKVYQNPHVITKTFPSGFSGHQYLLAVAGG